MARKQPLTMGFGQNLLLVSGCLMSPTFADIDGKAQYELFCGACHDPKGTGAGDGSFPPLAGSEWVKGDPERMVQVVIHGLQGKVKVKNKIYDLAMPPQGAALTDEQIAAIVTYVRGAWGNAETGVDAAFVAKARQNSAKREESWTSRNLLKKWPLPPEQGPLQHLISTVYKGEFKDMPDFSKLESDAVEEEASGFIDLKTLGEKDGFAAVWEGEFEVSKKGDYTFRLDSDDGSRLFINGDQVAEVKGLGPMGRTREGRALLEEGRAKLRLEYFENRGQEGIAVSMRKGGSWTHFTRQRAMKKVGPPSIPIAVNTEARIYRNFISGTSARAIGVGYPGGVNLAFSADDLGVSVVWLGDFMDGGRHWTGRGKGSQAPAGQRVVNLGQGPGFALIEGEPKKWPTAWQPEIQARFKGYTLDDRRRPEFSYELAGVEIFDRSTACAEHEMIRNLRLKVGKETPKGLMMRLWGAGAKKIGSHSFELKNGLRLEVSKSDGIEPVATENGVYLRINLKEGDHAIGLRYIWK